MSYQLLLYCDNDVDCERGGEAYEVQYNGTSIRELRARAKRDGWTRFKNADYCQFCSAEETKKK